MKPGREREKGTWTIIKAHLPIHSPFTYPSSHEVILQFHVVGGNSLLGTSEFVSGKEGWEFRKIPTEEVGWVEDKGSGQVLEGVNKEKDELCSLRMEQLWGEGWNGGGRKEESGLGNRVGEKMCCQPPGVRRQVGFKNQDVRYSTFSHGRCWDMNPFTASSKA